MREDLSLLSLLDGESPESVSGNNDWGWDDHPDNSLTTKARERWYEEAGYLVEKFPWSVTAILSDTSSFVEIH